MLLIRHGHYTIARYDILPRHIRAMLPRHHADVLRHEFRSPLRFLPFTGERSTRYVATLPRRHA